MSSSQSPSRSYLKWAGSKTKLVSTIASLIPSSFQPQRLIEPFVGSGAVALNLGIPCALLGDSNPDVIAAHREAVSDPQLFVSRLRKLFTPESNTPGAFSTLRDEFNGCQDLTRRAELFVYLNRHSFNGLVRYSKTGRFNAPFGKIPAPYLPACEVLEFSQRLQFAKFIVSDFRDVMAEARAGDLVYCDPPYLPLSDSANFVSYAPGRFTWEDHEDLAIAAEAATERGALVIVSNHATAVAQQLYEGASSIHELQVRRTISCHGATRGKAAELMAVYVPRKLEICPPLRTDVGRSVSMKSSEICLRT